MLVLSALLIAGCTSPSADQAVKTGDTIRLDYTGWFDNGTIFDTTDMATAQQAGIYSPDVPTVPSTSRSGQANSSSRSRTP